MILDVSVTEYRQTITAHEIGLVRDRQTISRLRKQYAPSWFASPNDWQRQVDLDVGRGFQWYVDKYSEVTTREPWNDVTLYFRRTAGIRRAQPTQGGLFYTLRNQPVLNIAAMASAAEAIAGWFCETHYTWDLVIRPLRVTPDMVFFDSSSRRLALVEVKSTSKPSTVGHIRTKLTTEMIKLLTVLAPTKLLQPGQFIAALIMVQVEDSSKVHLTSLVLEES
jgi:hypothetical protein